MPDWMTILTSQPPESVIPFINQRSSGMTERFLVHDHWSLVTIDVPWSLHTDEARLDLAAGEAVLLRPGTRRRFDLTQPGWHRGMHLLLPWLPASDGPAVTFLRRGRWSTRLVELIGETLAQTTPQARRAVAWHACCLLASGADGSEAGRGREAVDRALAYIATHLSEPLTATAVAAASGLSHNQLLRHFARHLGEGITATVIRLRIERAAVLLRSTDLPISRIAAEVGIHDRQQFNKSLRRVLGMPPRAVRAAR